MSDHKRKKSPVSTEESTSSTVPDTQSKRQKKDVDASSIGQDPPTCLETTTGYECSICLESSSLKEKLSLPCSHDFHLYCVASWLMLNGNCPVCRKVYDVKLNLHGRIILEYNNPGINMRQQSGNIEVSHVNGCVMSLYNVNIDERMFKDTFKNCNNGVFEIKLVNGDLIKFNNIKDFSEEDGSLRINDGTIEMRVMNACILRDSDGVRMILENGSFMNLIVVGLDGITINGRANQ